MNRLFFAVVLTITLLSLTPISGLINFQQLILNRFNAYLAHSLQEKIYLHTDKPYYSAGEDIWFKGYLVNAASNLPTSISNFMIVELINKSDSVVSRIKIRKDSTGFVGNMKLKPELSSGYYALRAYTNWMQNASADFYFSKNIYIGNVSDEHVLSEINYGNIKNDSVFLSMTFKNSDNSPINGKEIIIHETWNSKHKRKFSLFTNGAGTVNFSIKVGSSTGCDGNIEVSINMETFIYKKRFFLPQFCDDFDVQFFPESGNLLTGSMQLVAFKAIGEDGLSIDTRGEIYSDKDKFITKFSTWNKGMGKFLFTPLPNESYYAKVKTAGGEEKRFSLPKSDLKGIAIHLTSRKDKVLFQVNNQSSQSNDSLYLLGHMRGMVYIVQSLDDTLSGQVSASLFPPGIVSFSVVDTQGKIYCERLFFMTLDSQPEITMSTDKTLYGERELVELGLAVRLPTGEPCSGNFSISVTDSYTVKQDTLADNILSYLLLSSDIQGYIENPASYFVDSSYEYREKLDLLMLTQGWRRFNTADVVTGKMPEPTHFLEVSQTLSGKVKNFFGKPPKTCDVILYSDYKNTFKQTQTDSLGRYFFDGLEFPDSTNFLLKAERERSLTDIEIIPDTTIFSVPQWLNPSIENRQIAIPNEYLEQSKEKFFYDEGIRQINLEEVKVTAKELKKDLPQFYYTGSESAKLSSEEIDNFHSSGVLDIISRLSGVTAYSERIIIRNYGVALVLVDGIAVDMNFVRGLSPHDVAEVAVFKGASAAIFGSRGANGAVAITLKRGAERNEKIVPPINIARVAPMGYTTPTEFYVPKYDVVRELQNKTPDLRTTIYWDPSIDTDSTGIISLKFYTADRPNDYTVVLEGMTDKGEICRFTGVIRRD